MGIRLTLFAEQARLARVQLARNLRVWLFAAGGLVFLWACWAPVLMPPKPRQHCWTLGYQNGEHSRACGDSITVRPDPNLAGYFIVTVWQDDHPASICSWVTRAELE